MHNSIAVDSNILVYLHDSSDVRKRTIAENILAGNPRIPAQVISEYINVTRRLLDLPKASIITQCRIFSRVLLFARCNQTFQN